MCVCWYSAQPAAILYSPCETALRSLSCQYWPQCVEPQEWSVCESMLSFWLVAHHHLNDKRSPRSSEIQNCIGNFWLLLFSSSSFAWSSTLTTQEERSTRSSYHSNHEHQFPITTFHSTSSAVPYTFPFEQRGIRMPAPILSRSFGGMCLVNLLDTACSWEPTTVLWLLLQCWSFRIY